MELIDAESLVDEAAVLDVPEEAAVVPDVLEVPEVLAAAVVDEVPDVVLIPSADNAASSADNSGFESAELADEVDEDDEDAAPSHPEPLPVRRVAPTESRLALDCEPLTPCMLMMIDLLTG
jgi:hypothetical protein